MIQLASGDMFQSHVEALVNPVNCVGVMGKGLALQFKRRFPSYYRAYETSCAYSKIKVGQVTTYWREYTDLPRFIVSFPTKNHWRDSSKLEDIESGLASLVAEMARLDIRSIAIPALGCGNGGLQWEQVKPLIWDAMEKIDAKVLVYPPVSLQS